MKTTIINKFATVFATFATGQKAKEGAMRINIATLAIMLMAAGSFGCTESPSVKTNPKSVNLVIQMEAQGDAGVDEFVAPTAAQCATFGGVMSTVLYGANDDGKDKPVRIPAEGTKPGTMIDGKCVIVFESGEEAGQTPDLIPGTWNTEVTQTPANPDATIDAPSTVDVPNDGTPVVEEVFVTFENDIDTDAIVDAIVPPIIEVVEDITYGPFCGWAFEHGDSETPVAGCNYQFQGEDGLITESDDGRPAECPAEALFIAKVKEGSHEFTAICGDAGSGMGDAFIVAGDQLNTHVIELTQPVAEGEFCSLSTSYAMGPNLLTWYFQEELGLGADGSCVPLSDEDLVATTIDVGDCAPILSLLGTSTTPVEGIYGHLTVQADPDLLAEIEDLYTPCTMTATLGSDTLDIHMALSPEDIEMKSLKTSLGGSLLSLKVAGGLTITMVRR